MQMENHAGAGAGPLIFAYRILNFKKISGTEVQQNNGTGHKSIGVKV